MSSYWTLAPILFLALGLLGVLAYERLLEKRAHELVSIAPTFLALISTVAIYLTYGSTPVEATLLDWQSAPEVSVILAYNVDNWGLLLAALALFLGLCGQIAAANLHRKRASSSPNHTAENLCNIWVFAMLSILLNLVFSAGLAVVFISWAALGLALYVFLTATHGQIYKVWPDFAGDGESDGTDEAAESEARGAVAARAITAKQLAGFLLLGSMLLLVRGGITMPAELNAASLGLASAILTALALAAFLGLYPFGPWPIFSSRQAAAATSIPLNALPIIGSVYLLGRLYPIETAGGRSGLAITLTFLGLATVIIGAANAWRASDFAVLLGNVVSVEMGLAVLGFALGDANSFAAALLLFFGCVLSAQSVALSGIQLQCGAVQRGETDSATGSQLRRNVHTTIFAAAWLSLLGFPFTLGFVSQWLLFAGNFDLKHIALWPIVLVANGMVIVATARYLDVKLFTLGAGSENALDAESDSPDDEARRPTRVGGVLTNVVKLVPLVPLMASLAMGIFPNQALRWVIEPAAVTVLGESAAKPLSVTTVLAGGVLPGIFVTLMLIVFVTAYYAYPMPIGRAALSGLAQADGVLSGSASTRNKVLESMIDILTALVGRFTAADVLFIRGAGLLRRTSERVANLDLTVSDRYFYPALAVLGIIMLFIFLG